MKRGVLVVILLAALLIFVSNVNADIPSSASAQAINAYKCLENTTAQVGCSSLGLDRNIFSALTLGKCVDQLVSTSKSASVGKCFGDANSCDVKKTSQAVIALSERSSNINNYTKWILSQSMNISESSISWLLQINPQSSSLTSCSVIFWDGDTKKDNTDIVILDNGTITGSADGYLTLNGYNIKMNPQSYNQAFDIKCNQSFSSSFQFVYNNVRYLSSKVDNSVGSDIPNTFYVTDSLNATTCIKKGNVCDYESTLWGAAALAVAGDQSAKNFIPYLTAFKSDSQSESLIPESFLYYLTSENKFLSDLNGEQILAGRQEKEGYWDISSRGKFYDTAIALFFKSQSSPQKTRVIEWLNGQSQDSNGCWQTSESPADNFVNNAMLLTSVWGPESSQTGFGCESTSTNSCLSSSSCSSLNGVVKSDLSNTCPSIGGESRICCDLSSSPTQPSQEAITCANQGSLCVSSESQCTSSGGIVNSSLSETCLSVNPICCKPTTCQAINGTFCSSGNVCTGSTYPNLNSSDGKLCCVGTCTPPVQVPSCSSSGGFCTSRSECSNANGSILGSLSNTCSGVTSICCNKQPSTQPPATVTCESSGWTLCPYSQTCSGTSHTGLNSNGRICCEGQCSLGTPSNPSGNASSFPWTLIILGLVVLILIVVGVIIMKRKGNGKSGAKNNSSSYPSFPSSRSLKPVQERKIIPLPPSTSKAFSPQAKKPKASEELSEVLKKLKDMSGQN